MNTKYKKKKVLPVLKKHNQLIMGTKVTLFIIEVFFHKMNENNTQNKIKPN